jgi:hypothetical protein
VATAEACSSYLDLDEATREKRGWSGIEQGKKYLGTNIEHRFEPRQGIFLRRDAIAQFSAKAEAGGTCNLLSIVHLVVLKQTMR